jgi:hypothetical protein
MVSSFLVHCVPVAAANEIVRGETELDLKTVLTEQTPGPGPDDGVYSVAVVTNEVCTSNPDLTLSGLTGVDNKKACFPYYRSGAGWTLPV